MVPWCSDETGTGCTLTRALGAGRATRAGRNARGGCPRPRGAPGVYDWGYEFQASRILEHLLASKRLGHYEQHPEGRC